MRLPSPNEFFVGPRPIHRSGWSFRCQGFERARRKETNHIRQPSCWTDGRTDITVSYNSCTTPTTKGLIFCSVKLRYGVIFALRAVVYTDLCILLCMYVYTSELEKSAHPGNWLPSLRGRKRRKAAKKQRREIAKTSPKSKEKFALTAIVIFLVAVAVEIFSRYDIYTYTYGKLLGIFCPT